MYKKVNNINWVQISRIGRLGDRVWRRVRESLYTKTYRISLKPLKSIIRKSKYYWKER